MNERPKQSVGSSAGLPPQSNGNSNAVGIAGPRVTVAGTDEGLGSPSCVLRVKLGR